MLHKIGDRVKIKSYKWYRRNKDKNGCLYLPHNVFIEDMAKYCGRTAEIVEIRNGCYRLDVDHSRWNWTDAMVKSIDFEED